MVAISNGDYSRAPSGITADLTGRTVANGAGGTDKLSPDAMTLIGSSHDDVFVTAAGDGNLAINGDGGYDLIAVYSAGRSQAQITNDGAGTFDLTFTGTAIHAVGIDQINFIDGFVGYNPGAPAGLIVRLYQAALDRAPDAVGLANWTSQLNSGTPIDAIANALLSSSEFETRFPGALPDPAALVTQLWQNVYHTAPGAQDLATWVNKLNSGQATKAQVLSSLSETAQNYANTAGLFASGIFVANEQAAQVARLYYSVLNRPPDFGGLYASTNSLMGGSESLQQIAAGMTGSPEFQSHFGMLSDLGFVDTIYHNVYGVAPTQSTEAALLGALAAGTQTRASLAVGLSESAQHVASLAPVIEASGIRFA